MESLLGDDAGMAKKPQLDVTSRAFQSKKFIKRVLTNVSHSTFEGELVDEVGRAEQETGEALKQLIRDNLGTFIESKDAMDAVFTTDRELFSGEALEDITAAFEDAQAGCEGLVKPIMESYNDVQHSRQSHDILDKLYSVLSVPGALYDNCGVRVVLSRSAMRIVRNSRKRAAATAADRRRQRTADGEGAADDGEEDNEYADQEEEDEDDQLENDSDSAEEGGDEGDPGADEGAANVFAARGALEDLAAAAGGASGGGLSDYILEPGEELFFWYGTPLARLKDDDAQRSFEDTVSNHEGAVLCLRRAMLYMEENYDMEDGTLLAAEDVEDGNEGNGFASVASDNLAATAKAVSKKRKVSAVHRSPFTYKFSLALLRAALYLEDQLSEELIRANAADTVLIEDTLSMMMDVAIVTVKLWKFCSVLQTELRRRSTEHALDSLRDKLAEGVEAATASAGPSMMFTEDNKDGSSTANPSFAKGSTTGNDGGGGGDDSKQRTRRRYHPAQYFIASTRSMHARLTRASAASLLQEASEWKKKVAMSTNAEAERRQARDRAVREDEGTTTFTYGGGDATLNASLQFSGGMLGSITDSFVANATFLLGGDSGSPRGARGEDEVNPMSFTANTLRVGGFGDNLNASGHLHGSARFPSGAPPRVAEVETHAASILAAFRTPEEAFDTFTTFSMGSMDMTDILEGSCTQILMHSKAMLQQLSDRSDTEATIMAEGALLQSFAVRLSEACMANLEHVTVSYWGGIATTIHGGVFDFTPDLSTPLGRMLAELSRGGSGTRGKAAASTGTPAAASMTTAEMAGSGGSFARSEAPDAADTEDTSGAAAALVGGPAMDVLPEVKFIPVLPDGLRLEEVGGGASQPTTPRASTSGGTAFKPTLRDLSVQAVRRMTRSAGDVMSSLFLAFVNRAVLSGFVRPMSRYTQGDLLTHAHDEQVELHAAILVEVIIGQWERIMTQVNEAVLRIKVVIGESCSTRTVTSNSQVEEAGGLLAELEQLRTMTFRCYTHGIGMLAKAYITMLPMMQHGGSDGPLEHRVRARLSRDFVSTALPNKLLNLFSVILDRTVPFLRRLAEVFDSADLFAAKAEDIGPDPDAPTAGGARGSATSSRTNRRTLRRHRDAATAPTPGRREDDDVNVEADPVTQFVAAAHAKMVLEHMEEHEEILQALVSNLLQAFVDVLHAKAQRVSSGGDGGRLAGDMDARERGIVECMADALCLPTTVAPTLLDHLLVPCIFELVARQHTLVPAQVATLVRERRANFEQTYLPRVGENCQLAVDVMVGMYLAIPQQLLAREVRESGFATPLFDWQRLSAPAAATVRPYLSNCIVHIAKAHETLNWIHQPALGAAVTQRLVAHLAVSFVTAITADINAFEISLECSPDFLTHGMLLIEAEALTTLGVVNAVMESVGKSTKAGEVLPELVLARDALNSVTQALIQQDARVYESMGRAALISGDGAHVTASGAPASSLPPTAKERAARREEMVATAMANLRYMVAAICTHLEDTALLPSASPFQRVNGKATEAIAERLARRKEGYEVKHATKQRRATSVSKRKGKDGASGTAAEGASSAADPPKKTKVLSRRRVADGQTADPDGVPPLPPTPRTQEAEEAPAPPVNVDLAAALYQADTDAAGQQKQQQQAGERTGRRTIRRRRPSVSAEEQPQEQQQQQTPPSAAERPTSRLSAAQRPQEPEELPVPRRARRRVVSSAAQSAVGGAGGSEEAGAGGRRRERRAARFKRTGAL